MSETFHTRSIGLQEEANSKGKYSLLREGKAYATVYFRELEPKGDSFSYFVVFDQNAKILLFRILDYTSSYGTQVTQKKWAQQFVGKRTSELLIGKTVDGISGATLTVNSIVRDLQSMK